MLINACAVPPPTTTEVTRIDPRTTPIRILTGSRARIPLSLSAVMLLAPNALSSFRLRRTPTQDDLVNAWDN